MTHPTSSQSSSSSHRARAFREKVDISPWPVEVRWIPGHKGIAGNERADCLAKATLRDLAGKDTETPRSHASLARLARQRRQDLVEEWWSQNAPDAYRALGLMMRRRKPPELRLPRKLLHKLLAARTGHGDFAAYHRRFNHPDANLLCHCGQEKSPIHFLRCRASPTARANSHRALSSLIECEAELSSGSLSRGRETTCLANVGGRGQWEQTLNTKRRIVGSPKPGDPWPSYSPVPSPHLRRPHVMHSTSSHRVTPWATGSR